MPLTASADTLSIDNARLPFAEQIAFFKSKAALHLPSEHFDDISAEQHKKAFAVANAMEADLLADFYLAVEKAIADGQSIDWFRKQFDELAEGYGWQHTGSASFRTRTIYETNMLTSYAAGRDAQLADPELLAARPYLEYNVGPAEHHRPLHLSWAGLTLPHDDPWIETHRPVKAWGCHCWLRAVAAPTPGRDRAPPEKYYDYEDRHGHTHTIPAGVDYGFHAAGDWHPDPSDYPAPIAKDLKAALKRGGDAA